MLKILTRRVEHKANEFLGTDQFVLGEGVALVMRLAL